MTQKEQVLEALKQAAFSGTGITTLFATETLGVQRLSERIRELQADGVQIKHTPVQVPNRFGKKCRVMRYSLIDNPLSTSTEENENQQHGGIPA